MVSRYLRPMPTWMVVLLVLTKQGYGWNLPSTYYQGPGNGYVGGRSNQALAGASAGSWNSGGSAGGAGGFPFQGQLGGDDYVQGISGGLDRPGGFGANQWAGGDGRGGAVGGGAVGGGAGVSTVSSSAGADGTGFQQGGGISAGGPLATGTDGGVGYGNQGGLGNFGGSNVGQFNPNQGPGSGPDTGGSFGGSGAGFGADGHYHGNRPASGTYGHPSVNSAPSVQPWRYGAPASYGGARWPWHGGGYVYRVPVAHINPDGSYSFSHYTPHSSREETGHSNGNVEGTYGFQNDGAKHNFSFNATPDVDLRTGFGNTRAGALNPEEYGPQSVHSRGRLPLPATFRPGADDRTETQLPNGWSSHSGVDGGTVADGENGSDQSTLSVVGLPKVTTEATDLSQPTGRNQIVRGSTEPPVGANDLDGRLSQPNDAGLTGVPRVTPDGTTVRPVDGTVEQVVTRPENELPSYSNEIGQNGDTRGVGAVPVDRSYRFGYQTPDAAREEAADQAGNVRGSFSYNNEAGRNDLQYVAGAGMGFRPTGGSLAVPNGLAGTGPAAPGGGPVAGDRRYQFGYRTVGSERGTGFPTTEGSLSVPNGQRDGVNTGAGGVFGAAGSGLGDDGGVESQGAQAGGAVGGASFDGDGTQTGAGVGGNFGAANAGFGSDGRSRGFGNQGGQSGTGVGGSFGGAGFGADGRPLASGNQGTQFAAGTGGAGSNYGTGFGADGRPLTSGNSGAQYGAGAGNVFEAGGTFGTGFGSDGRSLTTGNQGGQFGAGAGGPAGTFGTGFGGDGRSFAGGNQGAQNAAGAGNGFGGTGESFGTGFGNQGGQFGAGARGTFGGSDGRSFGFGNQAGPGFGRATTAGFTGSQGTTRNPVTRSPSVTAFNGSTGTVSSASREDGTDEPNTTINADDSEQTTTFGGYGDVQSAGAGLYTNGNRRLVQ
ncbi:uncharacterized PE-PGRS family protein PE_PGRS54-like isoform X2 [Anopheles stephensi]|uniref:uncharacterized PE-PGRS family protein PE_PGRS54-like isoform X2 n=1 Tax=Anopheles stephensi TaxID=30069 RepID=UPI0016587944|nr:uncharacterized PE-PGRS family protein PE_PGRS54-like isoform X2 [Anopheles stephensi]